MTGRPVFADSCCANVLLPAPAIPVTTTRRPIRSAEPISLTSTTPSLPSQRPNGWRLSCERLLAGRKEPCSVQRRSTAQRTNERFPPAALGSFKRWLAGAASHAAIDQPDRPRNARHGPPDLRKPAQALGLRQSARGVGPRARAAGTRRAGCGRRRCGGRSCRARRRDSRRRCVPRRWHR
jgi:hypothetical protein